MAQPSEEAESSVWRCPWCGAAVAPGSDECPGCQQSLCPECGAAVGQHWSSCVACGARWDLLCPECEKVVLPRHTVCPHCGAELDTGQDEPIRPAPPPEPAEDQPLWPASGPACWVCGRQDETLRLVVLPFVFSLVLVTFRRSFAGIWCRRHRNQRWALAALITGVAGWIGIPFGVVYTSLALIKLARGGDQPREQNLRLLHDLAGHKVQVGDGPGAARCLEEALRLQDDEAGRARLDRLYEEQNLRAVQERPPSFWPFVLAALAVSGVGIGLGLAAKAIQFALASLLGDTVNLFLLILAWTPWIALLFLGGLALMEIVDRTLRSVACRQRALGVGLACLLAAMLLYGTLQGRAILDLLRLQLAGEDLAVVGGPLFAWFLLAAGPILEVQGLLEDQGLFAILHGCIVGVSALYYLWAATSTARGTVRWQQALASVRSGGRPAKVRLLQPGWLAIGGVVSLLAASLIVVPLTGFLTMGDALSQMAAAGDLEEMERVVEENPGLGIVRLRLALAYMERGRFEEAERETITVSEQQPDWALPHAILAMLYHATEQDNLRAQEMNQAARLGGGDWLTQDLLGNLYLLMEDYGQAELCYRRAKELMPDSAQPRLGQASVYSRQGRHDEALAACDEALALEDDVALVHRALGYVHIRREDLPAAREAFELAVQEAPEDASLHAALSYLSLLEGNLSVARAEAEAALRLRPYESDAQENLALACEALGDLDCALPAAREAVRLSPRDDLSHYALGLCYRDLGEVEEARQEFETFLRHYSDRPYVRDWKVVAEAYLAEHPGE